MTTSQQTDWETKFWEKWNDLMTWHTQDVIDDIKKLLASHTSSLLEKVEKLKKNCDHEYGCGAELRWGVKDNTTMCGSPPWYHSFVKDYNQALDDIKALIKEE